MFDDPQGPITHFEWASFMINGKTHAPGQGVGKDILLSAEGVSAWHQRKGHTLKKHMLEDALVLKPEVLLIGNGVNAALKVGKKVRKAAKQAGVAEVLVLPTPEACRAYNRLYHQGKKVVLLAHGTC